MIVVSQSGFCVVRLTAASLCCQDQVCRLARTSQQGETGTVLFRAITLLANGSPGLRRRKLASIVPKVLHEVRDPVHNFILVDNDERTVVDSRPVQRLRQIHQLAMSYLVYPGATHKRFEHSLGVMELAGRVYDIVTNPINIG